MPRAAFLDRDGTIIEDSGHLKCPSQAVFFPDTIDALRRLQEEFLLFIVTNQSGIAKGLITRRDADRVNDDVVERLSRAGIHVTDVYVCPHQRGDACSCIKPKAHFLRMAEARYGVDLTRSYTVGDHPHDVEFAGSAGAQGVFVMTGHGRKHRHELPPDAVVVQDIGAAARHMLNASKEAAKASLNSQTGARTGAKPKGGAQWHNPDRRS